MVSGQARSPSGVIGELLAGHPEAHSLLAEAGHRAALARSSAAETRRTFAVARDARTGYEGLRRRLDPRGRCTVNFSAGLLVLILLGAVLAVLDDIQMRRLLNETGTVLLALATVAVWLIGAWQAALAGRERRRGAVIALVVAATFLSSLLAVVHMLSQSSPVFGVLVSVLALAVAAGVSVLMIRMEPARVFLARLRWHRAKGEHEAAVRVEHDDIEAMHVATEAWLGLVRSWTATSAGDDEDLADRTVTLAVSLLEDGPPRRDRMERLLPGDPR